VQPDFSVQGAIPVPRQRWTVIALCVLIVLVLLLVQLSTLRQASLKFGIAHNRHALDTQQQTLRVNLDLIRGYAHFLSNDERICQDLNTHKQGKGSEELNKALVQIASLNEVNAAFLLDANGLCVASSKPSFVGNNYSFRPYFIRALQNGESLYVAQGVTSKQLGIYFGLA